MTDRDVMKGGVVGVEAAQRAVMRKPTVGKEMKLPPEGSRCRRILDNLLARARQGIRHQLGVTSARRPVYGKPGQVPVHALRGDQLGGGAADSRIRDLANRYGIPVGLQVLTWQDVDGEPHSTYAYWVDLEKFEAALSTSGVEAVGE